MTPQRTKSVLMKIDMRVQRRGVHESHLLIAGDLASAARSLSNAVRLAGWVFVLLARVRSV